MPEQSQNIINCPNCHEDIGLENADFQSAEAEGEFIVTCHLCNHTWQAHHRDFRPRELNPFAKLYVSGVD